PPTHRRSMLRKVTFGLKRPPKPAGCFSCNVPQGFPSFAARGAMSDHHELGPLLNRVRAGDRLALESLLAKIRPYLHLLVRQQLEPDLRHKLGDSDIVQETRMGITGGLNPASQGTGGQFQGRAPPEFLAWVSQIVRHVIVDLERRGMARKRDERCELPGSKILATLSQGSTPQQAAERAEKALQL